jgi:hypothetical protein
MYHFIILHSYFLRFCCSYRLDTIGVWRFSLCNILLTIGFAFLIWANQIWAWRCRAVVLPGIPDITYTFPSIVVNNEPYKN